MNERAIGIDCRADVLLGIIHEPEAPVRDVGVIVVVGGPQYRVGSHRQFLLLARGLAQAGYSVLRFDVRGMGDSLGQQRDFEAIVDDIASAIEALKSHAPSVRQVVLWGLCDGASAALLYLDATADPTVRGLCLANPWVRSEATLARTHIRHYYAKRLLQPEFWRNMVSGRALGAMIRGFLAALHSQRGRGPALGFQARMARAWLAFDGAILLVLSGKDLTALEFVDTVQSAPDWTGAMNRPGLTTHKVTEADHTFSSAAWRRQVCEATTQWLNGLPSVG